MSKKLFVRNLSYNTKDSGLKDAFSRIGTVVSAKVVTDRDTGRSRGFGFVEFSSEDEANRAIKELNGKEVDGREISVALAHAKK